MNRIEAKMKALQEKGEKAFITYITAGLPDLEGTKKLLKAQEEAGLDVVELGIPQGQDDIQVQGFAQGARLFGPIQNGDGLGCILQSNL